MKKSEDTVSHPWKNWMFVICFFGIFVALGLIYVIYDYSTRFHMAEHYDDTVISVEYQDRTYHLSLREFGYYIIIMERDVQKDALAYNPKDPLEYWNVYLGNEEQVGYIRSISKDYACQYAIRNMIYADQAYEAGYTMDEQAIEDAKLDTYDLLGDYAMERLASVGLDEEMFYEISLEVALSENYIDYLMEQGLDAGDLDLGGSYYQNLLLQYDTSVNEEVMEHLVFGSMTVN